MSCWLEDELEGVEVKVSSPFFSAIVHHMTEKREKKDNDHDLQGGSKILSLIDI